MDVITPGSIGPFSKYTMKKLQPCFEKATRPFFPRPITPHYPAQFCRLSFKHEFN